VIYLCGQSADLSADCFRTFAPETGGEKSHDAPEDGAFNGEPEK